MDEPTTLRATSAGRALIGAVAALALATIAGLVLLWPSGDAHGGAKAAKAPGTVSAKVVAVHTPVCPGPAHQRCRTLIVDVGGTWVSVTLGPVEVTPDVHKGDAVRVSRVEVPEGTKLPAGFERWSFVSVDRRGALLWFAVALLVLAVALLRRRGLLALAGVGLSLLLLVKFVVPAILDGRPALLVALVGSLAVMFVTLILTNGFGPQTLAAALGVGSTLGLTAGLGLVAVHTVALDGRSGEFTAFFVQQGLPVSLQGVVLAGIVIGAMGVLADTGVTQASAVTALRRANPSLTAMGLYREAFVVGRDHLSATIHTLVLAYAGTALPLLLVLHANGTTVTDALSLQDIAEPIAATLVGCLGLIAAVPVTTGLAAFLAARVPPQALGGGHGHHH